MKAIILAGGGGTRLWPLSREDFPKQFLSFGAKSSLLQKTIQRLIKAPWIDEILISTNTHHFFLVQKQIEAIGALDRVKVIVEPCRKNTAPAIGLAVRYLENVCHADSHEAVLVLPSDHLLEPESIFLHALEQMEKVARECRLITFGIRPTRAETGYGYIKIGQNYSDSVFEAIQFIEKPNRETAEKYLMDPHYYWNAGIFLFSIQTFWDQLKSCNPGLESLLRGSYEDIVCRYKEMPDISIDYAVMEKSNKMLVYPLAVTWSDIGSWDSLYEILEKDQNQNVKLGKVLEIDTKNCLILGDKRLIATIGLENLLIVETENAIFVSKKGESQRVKQLVQELTQRKGITNIGSVELKLENE